jgi:hypothetical protein
MDPSGKLLSHDLAAPEVPYAESWFLPDHLHRQLL